MDKKTFSQSTHIINDPIHGVMEFTREDKDLIKPIIDSPLFQRLRHIKQLGLTDLVFPGAVHTRFNHSLGACFLAQKIASHLQLTNKDRSIVLLSALLHDIGHGPFSHAFEQLLKDHVGKVLMDHEEWTDFFLGELIDDGRLDLKKEDLAAVLAAIKHDSAACLKPVLADIVSSQMDCDRLDYLLRDSHFCGVSYGNFDLNWLIASMKSIVESKKTPRLGITKKGVGSVEQLLIARRLMTQNVYYNGKVKAAENLLIEFLNSLMFDLKPRGILGVSHFLLNYLMAIRDLRLVAENKSKSQLRKELKQFARKNFKTYKMLTDSDVWMAIRAVVQNPSGFTKKTKRIAECLYYRKLPEVISIESSAVEGASYFVNTFRNENKLENWEVRVLDLPVKSYKAEDSPVLIQHKNSTRTLSSSSFLIGSVTDATEKVCFISVADGIESKSLKRLLSKKHYMLGD
ncbi:MAG: HD domain-containing protein [Proteobacteria bacterium]|nr:HD domain-containing protein [Pseudomonadota bacterium]